MIKIDVADANSQAIEAVLDNELFYIVLNWNSTNESWTLDIHNSAYDVLIYGIALAVNFPLTAQFRYPVMPDGELMAVAPKDRNGPIPRNGFEPEQGYELVYITQQECLQIDPLWM
jgi:hypothetical protein